MPVARTSGFEIRSPSPVMVFPRPFGALRDLSALCHLPQGGASTRGFEAADPKSGGPRYPLLTGDWKNDSLWWLTYEERWQRARGRGLESGPQRAQKGSKMQKDTKIEGTNPRIC
jgi:hypothetical protein